MGANRSTGPVVGWSILAVLVALIASGIVVGGSVPQHRKGDATTTTPTFMTVCGTRFCLGSTPFYPYGATFYQSTPRAGIDNPSGTIALARTLGFNTIRVVDFLDHNGDPAVLPFENAAWAPVDTMVADAQAAHIKVLLDLSDYKAELWDSCINPYTADWTRYLDTVANRTNTVTGQIYRSDPEIVLVTFTGEPLPVGSHTFRDRFGRRCTISYTTQQLTQFYARVESTWKSLDPHHLIAAGGLSYVDLPGNGIDWQSIFGNPDNDVCAWKTYGHMGNWLPTGASYCNTVLHKPWFDDEWGYTQRMGDRRRAAAFTHQLTNNASNGAAGNFFWNANYLLRASTYDVSPRTPRTEAVVIAHDQPLAP
jgi:hypothetical protein